MVAAVLDAIGILCDLNIIQNMTRTCYVVQDDNTTASGELMLDNESWTDFLNDMAETAGGWCSVGAAERVMMFWAIVNNTFA